VVDFDALARVAVLLGLLGVVLAAALGWWSSSLTVVVARARLSGWCASAGRLLRRRPSRFLAALGISPSLEEGGQTQPLTVTSEPKHPASAGFRARPASSGDGLDRTEYIGPLVRPYADPSWRPAWQRQDDRHGLGVRSSR